MRRPGRRETSTDADHNRKLHNVVKALDIRIELRRHFAEPRAAQVRVTASRPNHR
jgi:hypothetical protein